MKENGASGKNRNDGTGAKEDRDLITKEMAKTVSQSKCSNNAGCIKRAKGEK